MDSSTSSSRDRSIDTDKDARGNAASTTKKSGGGIFGGLFGNAQKPDSRRSRSLLSGFSTSRTSKSELEEIASEAVAEATKEAAAVADAGPDGGGVDGPTAPSAAGTTAGPQDAAAEAGGEAGGGAGEGAGGGAGGGAGAVPPKSLAEQLEEAIAARNFAACRAIQEKIDADKAVATGAALAAGATTDAVADEDADGKARAEEAARGSVDVGGGGSGGAGGEDAGGDAQTARDPQVPDQVPEEVPEEAPEANGPIVPDDGVSAYDDERTMTASNVSSRTTLHPVDSRTSLQDAPRSNISSSSTLFGSNSAANVGLAEDVGRGEILHEDIIEALEGDEGEGEGEAEAEGKGKGKGTEYTVGDDVEVYWPDRDRWFVGKVTAVVYHPDDGASIDSNTSVTFDIAYDDGEAEEGVELVDVRRPGTAAEGARGASRSPSRRRRTSMASTSEGEPGAGMTSAMEGLLDLSTFMALRAVKTGDKVQCRYLEGNQWFPGVVLKVHAKQAITGEPLYVGGASRCTFPARPPFPSPPDRSLGSLPGPFPLSLPPFFTPSNPT